MEKQKLQTRFDEVRIRIDDPKNLEGKMSAEDVRRKWMEDFVDEQTGEVVSVERSELVSPRGKMLTKDDVARIMFHMQSGEIKDVLVTNQIRPAWYGSGYNKYEVAAADTRIKKRILVYARGIPMALQIAIDYCEQTMKDMFKINSVKVADNYKVVSLTPKDSDKSAGEQLYYAVALMFNDGDGGMMTDQFLTAAKDADTACAIIRALIDGSETHRETYGDDYRITVSKNSPITDIVPPEFSDKYIKMYKTEEFIMDGVRVGQMPA